MTAGVRLDSREKRRGDGRKCAVKTRKTCASFEAQKKEVQKKKPKQDRAGHAAPPYCVMSLPGKGLAAVASRKIAAGELIIEEQPVLARPKGQEMHPAMLDKLPEATRSAIMTLHDSFLVDGHKTLQGIMNTNAFVGSPEDDGVLFLKISRFNHSCVANCAQRFHPYRNTETVYANRVINKGEELCLEYIDTRASTGIRQKTLRTKYNFTCTCEACVRPAKERMASDLRRARLKLLDEKRVQVLDETKRRIGQSGPRDGLKLVKEYMDMLQEEKLSFPGSLAPPAYDAFQFALMADDLALAKQWIKKTRRYILLHEGPYSEAILDLARYVQNPRCHPCTASSAL
eukprot:GEMP01044560.1.p1 GENE.GEMP01044560.1~~GEMP01044560.1.p1  ORF type:complete len:344 (+),score=93.21 GEMP01044560.1:91-1122(+)